jgi:hypothetical protein
MPKLNLKNVNVWPFRKAEDVFVGKKRRKK